MLENRVSIFSLTKSCSTLVKSPYVDKSATDATETPGVTSALGRPCPILTAVTGFSLSGSNSRIALPSHPSVPTLSGSAVCQISIDRKWDLGEFAYPIPWIMAIFPFLYMSLMGDIDGCRAYSASMVSISASGMLKDLLLS